MEIWLKQVVKGQGSSNLQDKGPNCYFGPMDCHFAHLANVAKDVP